MLIIDIFIESEVKRKRIRENGSSVVSQLVHGTRYNVTKFTCNYRILVFSIALFRITNRQTFNNRIKYLFFSFLLLAYPRACANARRVNIPPLYQLALTKHLSNVTRSESFNIIKHLERKKSPSISLDKQNRQRRSITETAYIVTTTNPRPTTRHHPSLTLFFQHFCSPVSSAHRASGWNNVTRDPVMNVI